VPSVAVTLALLIWPQIPLTRDPKSE
jgi:hypothetical protein